VTISLFICGLFYVLFVSIGGATTELFECQIKIDCEGSSVVAHPPYFFGATPCGTPWNREYFYSSTICIKL